LEPNRVIDAINAFNSVYQFLKNIKEISEGFEGRRLFGSQKKTNIMEIRIREALMGTKNAIEYFVWYGKGFAKLDKCNSRVDGNFDHLMGYITHAFNDIFMRLDPKKLDEKLVEHLILQLKTLENKANSFWNIQGIASHQKPDDDAIKIIEDFRKALSDFHTSMGPYLKPEA
jgi:hypothetical protein